MISEHRGRKEPIALISNAFGCCTIGMAPKPSWATSFLSHGQFVELKKQQNSRSLNL